MQPVLHRSVARSRIASRRATIQGCVVAGVVIVGVWLTVHGIEAGLWSTRWTLNVLHPDIANPSYTWRNWVLVPALPVGLAVAFADARDEDGVVAGVFVEVAGFAGGAVALSFMVPALVLVAVTVLAAAAVTGLAVVSGLSWLTGRGGSR